MKTIMGVLALLTLAACGSDTGLTNPTGDKYAHHVAGQWGGTLFGQWARQRDGAMGSFDCGASLTITQPNSSTGEFAGFLIFLGPCPPQVFDVRGVTFSDGSIRFTSGGPKPPHGQCAAALNLEYAGVVYCEMPSWDLSMHAAADIDCPGPGEGPQRMDYILRLEK